MPQTFQCPNCHAALEYDPRQEKFTVRCEYCQSTVIVPESLRPAGAQDRSSAFEASVLNNATVLLSQGRKIEAIKNVREGLNIGLKEAKELVETLERGEPVRDGGTVIQMEVTRAPATSTTSRRGVLGCAIFLVLAVGALGILIPLFLGSGFAAGGELGVETLRETVEAEFGGAPVEIFATVVPSEPTTIPPAEVALEIGGQEGTGPGFFNDTRQIEVDGEGRIYTADYDGGRIQIFDADGEFLDMWQLPEDVNVGSTALDRAGTLYVIQRETIQRYEGQTGALLEPLPNLGTRFRSIEVAPDGSLVAVAEDRLVRFDREGNVVLDVSDPFAQFERFNLFYDQVAVDGAGNIFVAGDGEIYRFSPDGVFVDRFGSSGDGANQFRTAPYAIAVDGQGRLFASNFSGILIFDQDGQYVDTLDFRGATFGMSFNTQNELLVMDRNGNRIVKYRLLP